MSRPSSFAITTAVVCLLIGGLIGIAIPPTGVRSAVLELGSRWLPAPDPHAEDEPHADHADGEHVDVSESARDSLGLKIAPVTLSDFVGTTRVPAQIIEKSAVSELSVVAQLEGVITTVYVSTGEAVQEGQTLFAIRLTGDSLASAQADLLDAVKQIEILDTEIARLAPIASRGVAAKTKLEREYERRRLVARRETKQQELLVRGLSPTQVDRIINDRRLITTIEVTVPEGLVPDPEETASADPWSFTIEELRVTPGSLAHVGDPLCDLAYHAELYVAGQAFARDLSSLEKLLSARRPMSAEFDDNDNPTRVDNLQMTYIDNHVDAGTGTYGFYLPIKNEVVHDFVDAAGRRFRQWRYKPGSRGHVLLPTRRFNLQIVLPREAVVQDGLESYVFVEQHDAHAGHDHAGHNHGDHDDHAHDEHAHDDHAGHDHEAGVIEFAPVPVRVLYENRSVRVVSASGQLKRGDHIAMNHAHTLLMAMRASDDAGGGHAHHGHSH